MDVIRTLVKNGAHYNNIVNKEQRNILHVAAEANCWIAFYYFMGLQGMAH